MTFLSHHTATTEIYTLSLHDALPILRKATADFMDFPRRCGRNAAADIRVARTFTKEKARTTGSPGPDRKSTRLNSSHQIISYAVFCLKKKNGIRLLQLDADEYVDRRW